jgi:hypothetical protein
MGVYFWSVLGIDGPVLVKSDVSRYLVKLPNLVVTFAVRKGGLPPLFQTVADTMGWPASLVKQHIPSNQRGQAALPDLKLLPRNFVKLQNLVVTC